MKKVLFAILFLAISACSEKGSDSQPEQELEEVFNLDEYGISFLSPLEITTLDLGPIVQGKKKNSLVTIKNNGLVPTARLTTTLNNSNFFITSSSCNSKLLSPGGSCSLMINFSALGKSNQEYTSILNFGPSQLNLRAEVVGKNDDPATSGLNPILKFFNNNISLEDINLGGVEGLGKKSQVIAIKNEGLGVSLVSSPNISEQGFYLTSNTCVNKSIQSNSECSVILNFSSIGKAEGNYSGILNFGGSSISVLAEVLPPPNPGPAQLIFLDGETALTEDLFLGSFNSNGVLSKTISVQNLGEDTTGVLSLSLENNSGLFYVFSNSCNNIKLKPNEKCSLVVRSSTKLKNNGMYAVDFKLDSTIQKVSYEKLNLTCESDEHVENYACEKNVKTCIIADAQSANQIWEGSGYSECTVQSCSSGFRNENNTCLPNVISCHVDNGIATQTWNGNEYGVCTVVSCEADFHNQSNLCQPNVISCNVDNGIASQTWNGTEYSSCTVDSCNSGFHIENNLCLPNVKSCPMNFGIGEQEWLGTEYTACIAKSCNTSYHINPNGLSCDLNIAACNIENGTGSQSWNGNSYNACTVTSCNNWFIPAANNLSCVAVGIRNYGTYRAFSNGTYAATCNAYRTSPNYINETGSGVYRIQVGAGTRDVYCDQVIDGGGWMLIARSVSGASNRTFGWGGATGSFTVDTAPYSMNFKDSGLTFTQVLFGNYSSGKTWGGSVYRQTVNWLTLNNYSTSAMAVGTPAAVAGNNSSSAMFNFMGFISKTNYFWFRDSAVDATYGLYYNGWSTYYPSQSGGANAHIGGNIDGQQGMIMVK